MDAHLSDNKNLNSTLEKAYKAHENQWALIVVDKITEKQIRSAGQTLANAVNAKITYMHMQLADGRTALLFYGEKHFQ